MAALPYFPLYPKDIFTDDRMLELKGEDQGIFLLFLCKLWINENVIKDNDAKISRILRIPERKWKDLKFRLVKSGLLQIDFDGNMTNTRLSKEFKESAIKSQNGLKAARAKWDKINSTRGEHEKIKTSNSFEFEDDFNL